MCRVGLEDYNRETCVTRMKGRTRVCRGVATFTLECSWPAFPCQPPVFCMPVMIHARQLHGGSILGFVPGVGDFRFSLPEVGLGNPPSLLPGPTDGGLAAPTPVVLLS